MSTSDRMRAKSSDSEFSRLRLHIAATPRGVLCLVDCVGDASGQASALGEEADLLALLLDDLLVDLAGGHEVIPLSANVVDRGLRDQPPKDDRQDEDDDEPTGTDVRDRKPRPEDISHRSW